MKKQFSSWKASCVYAGTMLLQKKQCKHYKEANGRWVVETKEI